jgi:hypothetical protein
MRAQRKPRDVSQHLPGTLGGAASSPNLSMTTGRGRGSVARQEGEAGPGSFECPAKTCAYG